MERLYLREFILVGLFTALIALGPFVKIPIPYLPLSLQILFVLLAGAVLRPVAAASAAALYIFLGFIGLPVFAGGSTGVEVILGGSGGYLFGFVLAAFIISWMVGARKLPIKQIALAMLLGLFIIYDLAMIRLAQVQELPLGQAFQFAVAPFIIEDLLKVAIAAVIAYKINQSGAFQTVFEDPAMLANEQAGTQGGDVFSVSAQDGSHDDNSNASMGEGSGKQ